MSGGRLSVHGTAPRMIVAAVPVKDLVDAKQRLVRALEPAQRRALARAMLIDVLRALSGAGLDRMTPEEYALFTDLNKRYRARHGIPFIRAVKGSTKAQIIEAFQLRLPNDPAVEFQTALGQVERILRFRLEDRVAP